MKTINILASTFILIALNANSFATTQSSELINNIEAQNISLTALPNLGSNVGLYSIAGRNKNNINGLTSINNFALSHTSDSEKGVLEITQKVGFFDVTKSATKGRNKLITGL